MQESGPGIYKLSSINNKTTFEDIYRVGMQATAGTPTKTDKRATEGRKKSSATMSEK
jgi:hypothetical protein